MLAMMVAVALCVGDIGEVCQHTIHTGSIRLIATIKQGEI